MCTIADHSIATLGHHGMKQQIRAILSEELHLDVPADDLDLFESGTLDSSLFIDLLLHLEERFGVKPALDDLEVENFATVERIAAFVAARATVDA